MTGPNVVLAVLDTVRGRDTVPASSSPMPTLAHLAASGTEFANAFSAAPWTLPSHASMFTGTYPSRHGAHGGHTYLGDSLRTLAAAFRDAGYETVGVSNNTWVTAEFGFDRGFETLRKGWQYIQSETDLGTVTRAEHPMAKLRAAGDRLFEGNPLVNAANLVYDELAPGDGAKRTTAWLESWLRRREESPFFLFLNFIEPHAEYRPPREYAEPYLPSGTTYEEAMSLRQDPRAYDVGEYSLTDREFDALEALYRGSLAYLDAQLARIRETLAAAGEWEDTVFVAVGDHGENVGDHGFFGHQYNLRDTLLHVPLVFRGGPFDGGGRRDELVQTLDLAPTLLDAAGVEDPELRRQSQGRSLHPDAEASPRRAVFAEYLAPQPSPESLRERFGEIPDRIRAFDRSLRAIRTREEKYVRGSDGSERYRRVGGAGDASAARNRAAENRERTRLLSDRLDQWLDSFEHAEAGGEVSMTDSTRERLSDLGYL
ncbi:sulfatase [Halopelagius longus]|uniref:Sulfatase n=1 Tax=Halopelagius longus TaxID=1236180 RepID=A0A1H0XS17_9EURY|nr:sulfatase [Halopelagius longus]RDI72052.1 sulfatase [Halopelagius longus]SDQ05704.1 Arylsulfatase A [Halopelagius longus]